ncbi:hypothetical protein N1851_013551 [Merluccius polli]|uniref:Uncharacterized protein n=1 Tax=Merluccius polli TaxID=89951 RepID=A0AA47MW39_MERPO|nr:hypothetical protein N1851_013551 [Merluccius polli]
MLLKGLHWLPVVARIRFKTMVLAYKAVNGTAPTYLQVLVRSHASAGALRSNYLDWPGGTAIAKS